MKHSIRLKLSILIMALMAGLVVFGCVFNAVFLEKYYMRQQQKALLQAFDRIKGVITDADINQDELGKVMYDISTAQNMTALILRRYIVSRQTAIRQKGGCRIIIFHSHRRKAR